MHCKALRMQMQDADQQKMQKVYYKRLKKQLSMITFLACFNVLTFEWFKDFLELPAQLLELPPFR